MLIQIALRQMPDEPSGKNVPNFRSPGLAAYGLIDALVAVAVTGLLTLSLYAGLSSGFAFVSLARENLRASQILVQRTEDYRLYGWNLITNSTVVTSSFIDYFDPTGTNSHSAGTVYQGVISNTPPDVPPAYRNNMRSLIVTVYWTNYSAKPSTNRIVHSRQMQTLVARWGMQNYVSR